MARRTGDTTPLQKVARALLAVVLGMSALLVAAVATAPRASAATTSGTVVYTAHESIPAPPPSNFAGSAGGDGWGLADHAWQRCTTCSTTSRPSRSPATCRATPRHAGPPRRPSPTAAATTSRPPASPGSGWTRPPDTSMSSPHVPRTPPQVWSASTPRSRASATGAQLFCGFTPLSAVGTTLRRNFISYSDISDPVVVGTNWYAFNEVDGTQSGHEEHPCCASA